MRVLMVSTSFPRTQEDWRGRFIADLVDSLSRQQEVRIVLWAPPGERPPQVADASLPEEADWLNRMTGAGGIAHLVRRGGVTGARHGLGLLRRLRSVYRRNPQADVVHVHWLQNALALTGRGRRVVVSVLGADFGLLRWPGMVALLRAVFRRHRVALAPNAAWMEAPLKSMFGDLVAVHAIPFGVAPDWFSVERGPVATLPFKWLVVSRVTRGKLGSLMQWGEGLFGPQRELHLLGPLQEAVTLPDWVQVHGPTHPETLRRDWLPQACGLLSLSRHDEGRPQVMIEAMAAGLPVVASALPAHMDLIASGETGMIVRSRDELEAALELMESPPENRRVGDAARAWVRENIGIWDDCAARYAALYRSLLEEGVVISLHTRGNGRVA